MTVYDFDFTEPFANGADSSEIQPFPDENRGLGIAFVQTDGKPEMKGLNGLFNKITKSLLSIRQNGFLGWVDDIEYIQGGFVIEGQKLYQAKVNNTNRKPSESQSDWELWTNASNIAVDANGNITKTTATNGAITFKVDDASIPKKGVLQFANGSQVVNKDAALVAITPKNASSIAETTDIGVGQSWIDVTGSRSLGVTYINQTGKPIQVYVSVRNTFKISSAEESRIEVGGLSIPFVGGGFNSDGAIKNASICIVIPNGVAYRVTTQTNGNLVFWSELRGN